MSKKTTQPAIDLVDGVDQTGQAFERFIRILDLTRTRLDDLNESMLNNGRSSDSSDDDSSDAASAAGDKGGAENIRQNDASLRSQEEHALRIGDILRHSISRTGNDFEASLARALGIAMQIAKMLGTLSAENAQGPGIFGVLGGIVSLLGSFDEGGYTGNTSPSRAAGIVHGGEVVFEKPIVDRNLDGLLALRSALQTGRSLESFFAAGAQLAGPTAGFSENDLSPLLAELRRLRREVRQAPEIQFQPNITIGQTFDTQRFFIDGDEQLQQYKRKKIV